MVLWGTKNWEVVKVGRSSASSSAHVRAGRGERRKGATSKGFLGLMKRHFGDLVVCSGFPVVYPKW